MLFHLASVLALSLPSSHRLGQRAVWQSPENQAQFAAWAKTLSRAGLSLTALEFEQLLWDWTMRYLAVRKTVTRPFSLYAKYLGMAQSWRMFSNPQTHPARLHIEIDSNEGFKPQYIQGSTKYRWRSAVFRHYRMRKLIGRTARTRRKHLYSQLSVWAAKQAAAEFPDAQRIRLRQWRYETAAPGEAATERNGKFVNVRTLALDRYRDD